MGRKPGGPTVGVRRYTLADGTTTETWSVRFRMPDGTRVRRTFATREEAEFEKARVALELSRTGASSPVAPAATERSEQPFVVSPTVAEFWETYIADARSRLAHSTVESYQGDFRRRVLPRFGDERMSAIRPRAISQWRAAMLAEGTGPESARRAMVLLQAMFTVAVEWGEVESNPVALVRKPRQGRDHAVQPLAPEAVEAVRAEFLHVGDLRSATLTAVLAYAGLRPGEALGLELRHVRGATILVERAVSDGHLKRQKTGRIYRTVDLLDPLAEDVAAWAAGGGPTGPDELLFPREDGGPWRKVDWDNWRNRQFAPATRRAGLGTPRPYDLRHSFASLLIREQRTSIVELAEQLGHAPTMTLSTYAHVFAEHRRAERVDVAEWIRRAREEAPALLRARRSTA